MDGRESAASGDGLNFDEIDEIDTSQMQIYDGAPTKNRRPEIYSNGKAQPMKSDSVEVPQSSNSGKSLLKNVKQMEEDLLRTSREMTAESAMAGTSSIADPMVFDATQVPSTILDEELFSFDDKPDDQQTTEDLIVTKYNPKHTEDIQRLHSVHDFSGHIDNVQNDLDSLKDLLRSDSYQMDSSQLLEVSQKS